MNKLTPWIMCGLSGSGNIKNTISRYYIEGEQCTTKTIR